MGEIYDFLSSHSSMLDTQIAFYFHSQSSVVVNILVFVFLWVCIILQSTYNQE